MKGPVAIFTAFAAICLIAIPYFAIAGTGGQEASPINVKPWDEDGKELFAVACGPCHTLQAAGADGVVGPNLDNILAPGGNSNYEGSYGRAINAVTCGFGGGRMPAGILQGENAQEVAAFVGAYAGALREGEAPLADTRTAPKAPAPDSCGAEASADN
jgi:cytochrome c